MKYWFIFCKTDLLLEKKEDGTYTIPCSEESPIPTKPWTHILNITPMEDGTEVKTFTIPEPLPAIRSTKCAVCALVSTNSLLPFTRKQESVRSSTIGT